MKRFLITVLGFVMLLCLASCSGNFKTNRAYVCGFSDSLKEIKPELEYDEWSKDAYNDSKQPRTVRISVGGAEYTGTYIESELIFGTNEKRHSYIDENNKIFELNDDGVLTAYFWGKGDDSDGNLDQAECKYIAMDFITDIFSQDLNGYEERITFDEERKMYTFEYVRMIGNLESEDRITVAVETSGHIYSYRSNIFGKINEDDVPDFNPEEIRELVSARLDDMTKEARKTYDRVEYKDFAYRISLISEEQYIILCDVKISCTNEIGDFATVTGEKLQFVIFLE